MSNQTEKITALYCRLSQEDEKKEKGENDSDSIVNQKEMLIKYATDNGFENIEIFVDDGYSGVSFKRPDFLRLLELLESGRVATLITKDLSRLGRNYVEVGRYTDFLFPRWNVRYIAINDNYDTLYKDSNELAPFKNLFNEWYARDTSKKVRAVFKAKAERGERVSTQIPYGYKRDPDVKGHLLIDEETAPIVKWIFTLCAEGKGPSIIANILKDHKILKPTVYRYSKIGSYGCITDTEDIYGWNNRTIAGILDNEVYLGRTVNCKSTIASFKDKRVIYNPESEWLRFDNTHEAIIDQDTWVLVREVRAGKRRRTKMGDVDKYSGLIHCADCGSTHYLVRGKTLSTEQYCFICSRYHKHMGEAKCTPHRIREVILDDIVLEEIRKITYYARTKAKEFAEIIRSNTRAENKRELAARTGELLRLEKRNATINTLFKRLYEDHVLGTVSDEQFRMLSKGYNTEQREIQERIPELQAEIEKLKAVTVNVQKFLEIAHKYTDLQELTADVLRTFVSKIVIHERSDKWSKTAEQQIDIYFRYIGNLAVATAGKEE